MLGLSYIKGSIESMGYTAYRTYRNLWEMGVKNQFEFRTAGLYLHRIDQGCLGFGI